MDHVGEEREPRRQVFGAPGGVQPVAAVAGPRGFAARGVTYVLIGVLAVQIGLGAGGKEADSRGALHAIAAEPGGAAVLWLLAAGFAGLALWRFAEAAYGQAGPGGLSCVPAWPVSCLAAAARLRVTASPGT